MNSNSFSIFIAFFGLIVSIFTLIYTMSALNIRSKTLGVRKSQNRIENLYKVKSHLDSNDIRKIRQVIYQLDPEIDNIEDLDKEKITHIELWGAEMDFISRFFHSDLIDRNGFFEIYADVILRSAFLLSFFANQRREERGKQYWIQYQKLVVTLLHDWKNAQENHTYPSEIKLPYDSRSITIPQLLRNETFYMFISNNDTIISGLE